MSVRIIAALVPLILVWACNRPQPKMSADEMSRIREASPGMTEACLRRIQFGGIEAMPNETTQCFRMLPQERWRGLWRNDFEGSIFCPAPATTCSYNGENTAVWLTPNAVTGSIGALYSVDFVGRRTAVNGRYGHLGMFAEEVVIDRPISIKMVAPPPPPPTKAELIAYWRRCEAAGTCIPSDEMRKIMNGSKQPP